MNRSPLYAPLVVDPSGRSHLIVIDLHGIPAARRLCLDLRDRDLTPDVLLLADSEATGIPQQVSIRRFETPCELLSRLPTVLLEHGMGIRLYVAGTESFVWSVTVTASEHGLQDPPIQRESCGPRRRRIYCIHCRTLTTDIEGNALSCPGCGRPLELREHFSPRLGAYLGLCLVAAPLEVESR